MLKSNSKIVRDRIREWIISNFDPSGYSNYEDCSFESFTDIALAILNTCKSELSHEYKKYNHQDVFTHWMQGLPSIISADYFVRGSAVKLVGDILEQTEEEQNKYSESDAENFFTYLIYRELTRVATF